MSGLHCSQHAPRRFCGRSSEFSANSLLVPLRAKSSGFEGEREAIDRAAVDLASSEFRGAKKHLRKCCGGTIRWS